MTVMVDKVEIELEFQVIVFTSYRVKRQRGQIMMKMSCVGRRRNLKGE